ncbi:MAG: DUF1801 domain-containing protein [Bacteroidota bacterium]
MAKEIKTKPTAENVDAFLSKTDEKKKKDALELLKLFKTITKEKPELWGNGIIGFGRFRYKYPTGQQGEWMKTGFSVRKSNFSLHLMSGAQTHSKLLKKLGKHKTGTGCVYINKLEDIDREILQQVVKDSWKMVSEKYK